MDLIDLLLAATTLEEKVGQLNLLAAGQVLTGPVLGGNVTENIAAVSAGRVFKLWCHTALE